MVDIQWRAEGHSGDDPSKRAGILGVDDNDLVIEALAHAIQREKRYHWLGHLPEATHLLDEVERQRPDIVLLDLHLPGRDPLSVLSELSHGHPSVRVIIVTGTIGDEPLDQAITAGAWGYVSKADGPEAIIAAIDQVVRGEFAVSRSKSTFMRSKHR